MYLKFMTPHWAATDGIPPVANEKEETGTHQQLDVAYVFFFLQCLQSSQPGFHPFHPSILIIAKHNASQDSS